MSESHQEATAGAIDPAALIHETVATLRNREETDTELLDILAEHILTMSPVTKGVADAASAIEALAARRAEEPEHGDAGHD